MNVTSPILASAARVAELPGDSVASLLKAVGLETGLFDDSPDGGLGIIMSALAGVAAALAAAILLTIYFRSGYRSRRDLFKHGLAASAVLILLAFVISDMRNAALASRHRPRQTRRRVRNPAAEGRALGDIRHA
jgi:hypothetical protein